MESDGETRDMDAQNKQRLRVADEITRVRTIECFLSSPRLVCVLVYVLVFVLVCVLVCVIVRAHVSIFVWTQNKLRLRAADEITRVRTLNINLTSLVALLCVRVCVQYEYDAQNKQRLRVADEITHERNWIFLCLPRRSMSLLCACVRPRKVLARVCVVRQSYCL